ncbi:MAG: 3-phosphoshikimate 1-carboxyvinyltransferase [Planctomycetia bacterium]|nr:3-phosphoshikimate 1-carboxyvinyltransferase [Planctomycetia bacterium]
MTNYPDQLLIHPISGPVIGRLTPPGSKSISNRALPLAALAGHPVTLHGCLASDDTAVMVDSLNRLGYRATLTGVAPGRASGDRRDSQLPNPLPTTSEVELFVGNSGTTMRFLTALVALRPGRYRLDGVPRMRERPIADLSDALDQLGIHISAPTGCPPVVVEGGGWKGGIIRVKSDVSSQFLSGLLLAAPFADCDQTTFSIDGPVVSRPYIDMTLAMLRQWGLSVDGLTVPGRQHTAVTSYNIEPDASAASYLFAAAAITGGRVSVPGLRMDSLQGDVGFLEALHRMGCRVERSPELTVHGGPLRGIDIDMNAISDTVMTLGAVALFAQGPTTIRNVAHIRHKETDRLAALATELRRLGAEITETADGLTIQPRSLQGATIMTYDDHRMAMSLALVGLRVPGVVINDPRCVAKTYPGFFDDLSSLTGVKLERVPSSIGLRDSGVSS